MPPQRLDAVDKVVFLLALLAGLYFATTLFQAGRDAGALALLGAVTTALSGYWSQLNAQAARQAALLVQPPAQGGTATPPPG